MHDTPGPPGSTTVETYRLRWDLVRQRCEQLQAGTDIERAELMGISRATLDRWRKGTHTPRLDAAQKAAASLGLPSDAMWERVNA